MIFCPGRTGLFLFLFYLKINWKNIVTAHIYVTITMRMLTVSLQLGTSVARYYWFFPSLNLFLLIIKISITEKDFISLSRKENGLENFIFVSIMSSGSN